MRVGLLTASISRNAGGLLESVRGLARALNQIGNVHVSVFGVKDSNTVNDIALWNGLVTTAHRVLGPDAWSYAPSLPKALVEANLDLVHSHGGWMYPSLVGLRWKRKTGKRHLITPQGMLDPWAVRHSRWKKIIVGVLYENAYLREAACLHAVCQAEAEAIRAYGLRNPIIVIPNGVDLSAADVTCGPAEWAAALPNGAKVLLYLGRLHEKKGVKNLILGWSAVRRRSKAIADCWHLVIAGHGDPTVETQLRQLVVEQTVSNSVHFTGPQYGQKKLESYQQANALILPSFSEGQPMVILEAWASRLPILMTPQCNLPEGFIRRCALRVETNPMSIADGITALFEMSEEERVKFGHRARQLVTERYQWSHIAKEVRKAYEWILDSGPAPDCLFAK